MRYRRFFGVAAVLSLSAGLGGAPAGETPALAEGTTVFVSAGLESLRKSPGPTVAARGSYGNVGAAVQHAGEPYVVEACSPLRVTKHLPKQGLLRTKDARGMKHTFAGDWSARLHATEQECKEYLDAHPAARVTENTHLRYELQRP